MLVMELSQVVTGHMLHLSRGTCVIKPWFNELRIHQVDVSTPSLILVAWLVLDLELVYINRKCCLVVLLVLGLLQQLERLPRNLWTRLLGGVFYLLSLLNLVSVT